MKKIVNGFVIFKKDAFVIIGDAKRPEGDQLLLSKAEDGRLSISIASKMVQQNSFSLDFEALQTAVKMLVEPECLVEKQACQACFENEKLLNCYQMSPYKTFCQAARVDFTVLGQCPMSMDPEQIKNLCHWFVPPTGSCRKLQKCLNQSCSIEVPRDLLKCLDFEIYVTET